MPIHVWKSSDVEWSFPLKRNRMIIHYSFMSQFVLLPNPIPSANSLHRHWSCTFQLNPSCQAPISHSLSITGSITPISRSLEIHLCTFQNALNPAIASPKLLIPIVIPVTAIFFFNHLPCNSSTLPALGQATSSTQRKIPGISFHFAKGTSQIWERRACRAEEV